MGVFSRLSHNQPLTNQDTAVPRESVAVAEPAGAAGPVLTLGLRLPAEERGDLSVAPSGTAGDGWTRSQAGCCKSPEER